jgi:hypothetical protein
MSLSPIGFPLKGFSDVVPDLRLVLMDYSPDTCSGFCGQIEHLKESPIKSDQILLDEAISSQEVIVHRKLKQGADGIIGVERQTMAVRDQDEEKVQQQLFLIEGRKKAIREKAVGDKAEAALNASHSIGVEDLLLDHCGAPRSMMICCREDPLSVSITS